MKKLNVNSHRWLLAAISGFALACMLTGYAWLTDDQPISIAAHVWLGYEPMFMARNEGWLNKEQVKLVETTSASDSLQALAEGRVDGAALTLDEMLQARASGLPLTAVLVFNISAGADMLLVQPSIKTLANLKGKRVAVEKSSVGEVMLAEVLRLAGLTRQDITIIWLPIDKHLDAWRLHQYDAVVTYEPVASQIVAQGAIKVFDSRKTPNTIVDVLAIRSDRLDHNHARALRHLILTHFKSLHHLIYNSQDASYRMSDHLGLAADDVRSAYKGLLLPDAENNYRLLAGNKPELENTARKLSTLMVKAGTLQQDDTFKLLNNADFLPIESFQ